MILKKKYKTKYSVFSQIYVPDEHIECSLYDSEKEIQSYIFSILSDICISYPQPPVTCLLGHRSVWVRIDLGGSGANRELPAHGFINSNILDIKLLLIESQDLSFRTSYIISKTQCKIKIQGPLSNNCSTFQAGGNRTLNRVESLTELSNAVWLCRSHLPEAVPGRDHLITPLLL